MRDKLSFGASSRVFYFNSSGDQISRIDEDDPFTDSFRITDIHHQVDGENGEKHLFSFNYANVGTGTLIIACTEEVCEVTKDAVLAMTKEGLRNIVGVLFEGVTVKHRVARGFLEPVYNDTEIRPGTPEKSLSGKPTPRYLLFDGHSVLVNEDGTARLTLTQLLLLYEYKKVNSDGMRQLYGRRLYDTFDNST